MGYEDVVVALGVTGMPTFTLYPTNTLPVFLA